MRTLFRLIHVRTANCRYTEAEAAWTEAHTFIGALTEAKRAVSLALLYAEYCALLFAQSLYDQVMARIGRWFLLALAFDLHKTYLKCTSKSRLHRFCN